MNDNLSPGNETIATDWNTEAIVERRNRFYSASQRKFVPYETPLIFHHGKGQYLWDEAGNKYIDLLGMNVCISVGHAHPEVVRAVQEQVEHRVTASDIRDASGREFIQYSLDLQKLGMTPIPGKIKKVKKMKRLLKLVLRNLE